MLVVILGVQSFNLTYLISPVLSGSSYSVRDRKVLIIVSKFCDFLVCMFRRSLVTVLFSSQYMCGVGRGLQGGQFLIRPH